MDIGLTSRVPETYWEPMREPQHEHQWSYVDALGKGKGGKGKGGYGKATGKGFNGTCYMCGETGHLARDCQKGKGKGKGKGLICWGCGKEGHPQFMCPENKGKGKGKQWGKGYAKGTYAIDEWEPWGETQYGRETETGTDSEEEKSMRSDRRMEGESQPGERKPRHAPTSDQTQDSETKQNGNQQHVWKPHRGRR